MQWLRTLTAVALTLVLSGSPLQASACQLLCALHPGCVNSAEATASQQRSAPASASAILRSHCGHIANPSYAGGSVGLKATASPAPCGGDHALAAPAYMVQADTSATLGTVQWAIIEFASTGQLRGRPLSPSPEVGVQRSSPAERLLNPLRI